MPEAVAAGITTDVLCTFIHFFLRSTDEVKGVMVRTRALQLARN